MSRQPMDTPYGMHLPIFPCLDYAPITEDRIERTIERLVDCADAAFLKGLATQEQYDAWNVALNSWSDEQYRKGGM